MALLISTAVLLVVASLVIAFVLAAISTPD